MSTVLDRPISLRVIITSRGREPGPYGRVWSFHPLGTPDVLYVATQFSGISYSPDYPLFPGDSAEVIGRSKIRVDRGYRLLLDEIKNQELALQKDQRVRLVRPMKDRNHRTDVFASGIITYVDDREVTLWVSTALHGISIDDFDQKSYVGIDSIQKRRRGDGYLIHASLRQ